MRIRENLFLLVDHQQMFHVIVSGTLESTHERFVHHGITIARRLLVKGLPTGIRVRRLYIS